MNSCMDREPVIDVAEDIGVMWLCGWRSLMRWAAAWRIEISGCRVHFGRPARTELQLSMSGTMGAWTRIRRQCSLGQRLTGYDVIQPVKVVRDLAWRLPRVWADDESAHQSCCQHVSSWFFQLRLRQRRRSAGEEVLHGTMCSADSYCNAVLVGFQSRPSDRCIYVYITPLHVSDILSLTPSQGTTSLQFWWSYIALELPIKSRILYKLYTCVMSHDAPHFTPTNGLPIDGRDGWTLNSLQHIGSLVHSSWL